MTVFLFLFGLFQCVIFYFLGRTGDRIQQRGQRERELAQNDPPYGWPPCAMIVPVSGSHPVREQALESLAQQDYPDFTLYLVTAGTTDAACALVGQLQRRCPRVRHVIAGETVGRGQKNHNLLAGIDAADKTAEVYVFCDSTHIAQPAFLRCLVNPLARREAAFATGYHKVAPRDERIVTLAYALNVLFMHFMQGLPALVQPWGGAMAMSRSVFERYHVRQLWETNVVDDCSLASLLAREGIHVRLCAGAILTTYAECHSFAVWRAWLERQILFLKFCMPGEWLALSLVCLLMTIPPAWCAVACLDGILGLGGGTAPLLALCWFCVIGWTIGSWRRFFGTQPAISRWLGAFFCSCFVFAGVWLGTTGKRSIVWNRIIYAVGRGGRVTGLKKS